MKKVYFILALLIMCLSGCQGLIEVQDNLADLTERVDGIEEQLNLLSEAFENGKIITDVKRTESGSVSGWTIVFSDNTSITVSDGTDGADGITPLLRINAEGNWEISYDYGVNFELLLDSDGNPVQSRGPESVSVRVVIDANGNYVLETYYESDPDKVIESITTPYSSNPYSAIESITKDPVSGTIVLAMKDGETYTFNLDVKYPTSIVVLSETIILSKNGQAAFAFRVNPSNAVLDLNLEQENPMIELDMVNSALTRSSYVTDPSNYKLMSVEPALGTNGEVKQGQYVAIIKDLGQSSDYCEGVAVVINSKDGNRNDIQISSEMMKIMTPDKPQFTLFKIDGSHASNLGERFINVCLPYGTDVTALRPVFQASEGSVYVDGNEVTSLSEFDFSSPVEFTIVTDDEREEKYIVSISYSDIPVVYINTKDASPIVSKVKWLEGTSIYVTNAGEHNALYSKAQIRGRGNTTWNYAKKPYAIKLDKKAEVLGMPKHKRWVLLANYVDKTCIRNSIAFELAKMSPGLDWTPKGYHVDVVLNGKFMGNYFLCEQIKVDENRVDITEMETTDNGSESITGGYLLEIDRNFDEVNKFYSPVRNMPFMIKEPDEETLSPEQFAYIQNHITEVENALYGEGSTAEGFLKYIDIDSFIDYWFVYDLTSTGEPTHPKSVYMFKDRNDVIHAGPVWDFDYYTYQSQYNEMLINMHAVWNDRILHDPAVRPIVKARWNAKRESYRSIINEIDRQYNAIKASAEYNATLWPLSNSLNVNKDGNVAQGVQKMKTFYEIHFNYMDQFINSYFN